MTVLGERTDDELMALVLARDPDALSTLYDRHHGVALAVAYRTLSDRESAEDVVQEAFVSLWRNATSFRSELGTVRGWLVTIARNLAISRLRRVANREPAASLDDVQIVDRAPEVWRQAAQLVERSQVMASLNALPPEQRDIIELAYYSGMTHQEISQRLGLPLGTVKGRLRLGMEKLRRELVGQGFGPGDAE
ncbi:MAG: sigma-70 family RNA polymerase sigma factor [Chloroflexota bacterium]